MATGVVAITLRRGVVAMAHVHRDMVAFLLWRHVRAIVVEWAGVSW
jgi:hypothetical protein